MSALWRALDGDVVTKHQHTTKKTSEAAMSVRVIADRLEEIARRMLVIVNNEKRTQATDDTRGDFYIKEFERLEVARSQALRDLQHISKED
jgi:hypothetical protein